MSVKKTFVCDRCGAENHESNQGDLNSFITEVDLGEETVDLCPRCRDKFRSVVYHWLNQTPVTKDWCARKFNIPD